MKFSLISIRDIKNLTRSLVVGLNRLSFADNFEGFTTTITIPAASVATIRNELTFIPSSRIILRQSAEANISDSTNNWTEDYLYLENHHATNEVTLKVVFLK